MNKLQAILHFFSPNIAVWTTFSSIWGLFFVTLEPSESSSRLHGSSTFMFLPCCYLRSCQSRKNLSKRSPKTSKNPPKSSQDASKRLPKPFQEPPRASQATLKRCPRAAKDHPRAIKNPPEAPKSFQRVSQTLSRASRGGF